MIEEKFTLVAQGVDIINGIGVKPGISPIVVKGYWMTFRSLFGEEFTIRRRAPEDLPTIELGATHWVRIQEEAYDPD